VDAGDLWYFAYGSNLDPGTFLGRRGMRPREARAGRLDAFELCFDLPVGPGDRGVANVRPKEGTRVWGVAYRLAAATCEHLDRTEGVHRGTYVRLPVQLATEAGTLRAFTYQSAHGKPGRKPSRRYLGLLLTGARHHGLPADYVEWLRSLPVAVDERVRQLSLW
jgi:cation transport regulator ChaC